MHNRDYSFRPRTQYETRQGTSSFQLEVGPLLVGRSDMCVCSRGMVNLQIEQGRTRCPPNRTWGAPTLLGQDRVTHPQTEQGLTPSPDWTGGTDHLSSRNRNITTITKTIKCHLYLVILCSRKCTHQNVSAEKLWTHGLYWILLWSIRVLDFNCKQETGEG